jgi:hypothetical protein
LAAEGNWLNVVAASQFISATVFTRYARPINHQTHARALATLSR